MGIWTIFFKWVIVFYMSIYDKNFRYRTLAFFLFCLFLISFFSCKTIKSSGDIYEPAGKDDTEFLQNLLNSNSKKIIIPGNKTWITKPLFIQNKENTEIVFERGCIIKAARGEFKDITDFLITLSDCKNVKLTGYGALLKMRKDDYTSRAYKYSQWRHGIAVFRCENTDIAGFRIQSTGGDGIYIGHRERCCKNIGLKDLILENNYRQGVSVVSADGFVMENCAVFGTRGQLPKSGIDFEPNNEYEVLKNCVVRNCSFMYNKGSGIHIYLDKFGEKTEPVDIVIENCISAYNLAALSIMKAKNVKGKIKFINCTFKGLQYISVPKTLEIIEE